MVNVSSVNPRGVHLQKIHNYFRFTPALRELRSVAWCVQLSATKQDGLSRRLQQICDRENLRCDATTLRRLCEMCANDMRHSINTLQWVAIAARKNRQRQIGMKLVQEVMAKEKSGAASIFENWAAVLEVSKHLDGKGAVKSVHDRVLAIQKIAADHGGEDRFVSGLYANCLVSLPIGQIRKASRTFLFYDALQKITHTLQNWTVQRYNFVFFVKLHLTIATHARVNIIYPQIEQNSHQKLKESEETLNCVRSNGNVSKGAAKKDLLLDILPFLVAIVQPPIKPMNEQLYTQRDLSLLNSTVSAMVDYGLTYSATMVKDQINWLFSPSIDILTMFPILGQKRNCLANAVRQIIAHKITLLRVNLAETSENSNGKSGKIMTNTEKIKQIVDEENMKTKNVKRLSTGAMKRQRYQQLSDVIFNHQDGDSSAVKKKITMHQMNCLLFGET
ncbi:unnamed protein product [Caenorhabditis angaria]|uniref:Uncharacterized protein n=1 Tax=Caenorhabditis angaria TaxID=860376 RepID=A0A9P1IPQ6_9PELO|nr:unnamed protein product [Caenorhabditis angaria]